MGKVHQHRMDQGQVWLFCTRSPVPSQGTASQADLVNYAVYFHLLGTLQAQDRLVCETSAPLTSEVLPHDHQGCNVHQSGSDGH
jgi:hypothetical protein